MRYAHIISAVLNTPWAILPEKLQLIAQVMARRERGIELSEEEIRERIGALRIERAPYFLSESGVRMEFSAASAGSSSRGKMVAVIPVYGIIGPKAAEFQKMSSSGGTGIDALTRQFREAVANSDVKSIVLDIDSPGGNVLGVTELANEIRAAREEKKCIAQISPLGASAAYWLASQCSEVVVTPSGLAGSIGVYTAHEDLSKAMEMEGVKVTLISAGKYKVEGNPWEPLDEEAHAARKAEVDTYYGMFTEDVAAGRGVKVSAIRNGFGEGRLLTSANAKKEGVVDRVAPMDDTLARLGVGANRSVAPAARALKPERYMGDPQGQEESSETSRQDDVAREMVPNTASAENSTEVEMNKCPKCGAVVDASHKHCSACGHNLTAAAGAADPNHDRLSKLAQLASINNLPSSRLEAWINNNTSYEAAQAEVIADLRKQATPVLQPPAERQARIEVNNDPDGDGGKKMRLFKSFGDQMQAIVAAGSPAGTFAGAGRVDERLLKLNAAASGGSASVPSDGGFMIQTDFSQELFRRTYETGALASRCSRTPISDNSDSLEVPYVDESSRANGSRWGGVRVFRANEADAVTGSKPKLGKWECRLEELKGVAYATERLLRDASAMSNVYMEAFSEEFAFVLDDEIFGGDGVGKCLGILNSGCLATVAKEGGQAADTIVAENIVKMWSRCWGRSRLNAAWFINQEVEPQLHTMKLVVGTGGVPIFMPAGGLSNSPYSTLYGRPIIPIEQASALGDLGDIVLADCSQYKLIDKDGIQSAQSIHFRFIYDEMTFKWNMRVNGAPKWKKALTPYKGAAGNTLSPFVALAAR